MAGMKYKDIAEKYGTTINTVKSWKKRYAWSREVKKSTIKKLKMIPKKTPVLVTEEFFKEIIGSEGKYLVSNFGYVLRRKRDGSYIRAKESKNDKGYVYFKLCLKGEKKTLSLHRTVAKYFVDNPNELSEVNHIDEDKSNNNAGNLEWCTPAYNNCYGTRLARQVETRMAVK